MQLEYGQAQASLTNALRKAPEVGAVGFRVQVQKLLVIVELLMGEIPQRAIFTNPQFLRPLTAYFEL